MIHNVFLMFCMMGTLEIPGSQTDHLLIGLEMFILLGL